MKNQYQPEKMKWDQDDFDQMGWHDCVIYAMSFDNHVKFDLDYIFQWVLPEEPGGSYRFWVSPATLIFKSPTKLGINLATNFVNGLEIADIEREFTNDKSTYIIELQQGHLAIETQEYIQIIRNPPILKHSQELTTLERGPISFAAESEE